MKPLPRETLIGQGKCCGNKCVNCPYTPAHVKGSTKIDTIYEGVLRKIDNKTITTEDLNLLISETTPESVRDRIRRRTIRNTTKSHIDGGGHQRLKPPQFQKRITPKRKPSNQQNHGRGKLGHRHSTRTQRRNFSEELNFIRDNFGKPIAECDMSTIDYSMMLDLVHKIISLPNVNRDWLYELKLKLEK